MTQKKKQQLENLKAKIEQQGATIKFILPDTFNKIADTNLKSFIFNIIKGTYAHSNQVHWTIKFSPVNTKRYRQQFIGHSRSLGDLYMICKHYYHETTMEDVVESLQDLIKEDKICSSYCTTFRARMFKPGKNYSHSYATTII